MPRKKARVFTPEEISVIRQAAAIRLPMEDLAAILSIDKSNLIKTIKKNPTLQATIDEGRGKASLAVRQRLYSRAVKDGDMRALEFWCKTQEGFKTVERVEHTGLNGKAIHTVNQTTTELKDPTRDEILKELQDLNERLSADAK